MPKRKLTILPDVMTVFDADSNADIEISVSPRTTAPPVIVHDAVDGLRRIADYIRRRAEYGRMDVSDVRHAPGDSAGKSPLTAQEAMSECAAVVIILGDTQRFAFDISTEADREEALTILLYLNDFLAWGLAEAQFLIDHEADDELVRQRISRAFCAADAALHDRIKSYVWRDTARERVAEYKRFMDQEDGDGAGLPDPIGNAELARRAGIDSPDRMSTYMREALVKHYRESGEPDPLRIRSERGSALYWSHDDLRLAYPHLPKNSKIKSFLSTCGIL